MITIDELSLRLKNVKWNCAGGLTARCPAHDDKRNSLSVNTGDDGKILLKCHAGCNVNEICAACGILPSDLFAEKSNPQKEHSHKAAKRIAKTYAYTDETGKLIFQVVRYEPKEFRQRRPDGKDGWIYNLQGIDKLPLYNLPAFYGKECIVWLVEGEKDADTLISKDIPATTCSGGAKNWKPYHADYLRGCCVYLCPDNDDVGREHMNTAARSLQGVAAETRLVDLRELMPDLPEKGDITDYFERGGDFESNAPRFKFADL